MLYPEGRKFLDESHGIVFRYGYRLNAHCNGYAAMKEWLAIDQLKYPCRIVPMLCVDLFYWYAAWLKFYTPISRRHMLRVGNFWPDLDAVATQVVLLKPDTVDSI